jgi:hypothetical protein
MHSDSLNQYKAGYLEKEKELFSFFLTKVIRIYQVIFSSRQGDVCNFTPSCSRYGYRAIKKHGLRGVLMTADRLERCNCFAWYGDYKVKRDSQGRYKLYDPVEKEESAK